MRRNSPRRLMLLASLALVLVTTSGGSLGAVASISPISAPAVAEARPAAEPPGNEPPTDHDTQARTDFGMFPLSFVPNAGQSDRSVHFQVHTKDGGALFFTQSQVVLSLPPLSDGIEASDDDSR